MSQIPVVGKQCVVVRADLINVATVVSVADDHFVVRYRSTIPGYQHQRIEMTTRLGVETRVEFPGVGETITSVLQREQRWAEEALRVRRERQEKYANRQRKAEEMYEGGLVQLVELGAGERMLVWHGATATTEHYTVVAKQVNNGPVAVASASHGSSFAVSQIRRHDTMMDAVISHLYVWGGVGAD